jgi:hypothetical protein
MIALPSRGRRAGALRLIAAAMALAACEDRVEVRLPATPPVGFAFAALLESGRPVELGAVVEAGDLYRGTYAVRASGASREVALAVVDPATLRAAAAAVCGASADPIRRRACRRAVDRCARADECLAVRLDDDCGERLPLEIEALAPSLFTLDAGGRLVADPTEPARRLAGVRLCGPAAAPACPDRVPGFALTEGGRYACLAASEQRACSLRLDLDACGLGDTLGVVDDAGTVAPEPSGSGGCVPGPLAADETTLSGLPGFALDCSGRRFVATYIATFPGEAECGSLGPSPFDNDLDDGGAISGALGLDGRDGPELVLVGKGEDQCAIQGCARRSTCSTSCRSCCELDCLGNGLERCLPRHHDDVCGTDPGPDCVDRCERFCSSDAACESGALEGRALAVVDPAEPLKVRERVELDGSGPARVALRGPALASIGPAGSPPILVTVDRGGVIVLRRPDVGAAFERWPEAAPGLDFAASGVRALPGAPGRFVVFGASTDPMAPGGRLRLVGLDLGRSSDPIVEQRSLAVPELPSIDDLASVGGALFAIARRRPTDGRLPSRVVRIDADLSVIGASVPVDGAPLAIVAVDARRLAIGLEGADGGGSVVILDPDRASDATRLDAPPGLEVRSLLADLDGRRLWVGYRRASGATRPGAPVATVEDLDGRAWLAPPFFEAAGTAADLLALSPDGTRLWAISGSANRITPVQVLR